MDLKKIFTIPNLFSFIRIFLIIPIFYYISHNDNLSAIIFIFIAFITDGLDGYLARKLNKISDFGKLLDPFADKICTTGGFIALSLYQDFPVWITISIIFRDIVIAIGSFLLMGRKKVILPSNKPGKWTIFFITLLGAAYLFKFQIAVWPLILITVVMIGYSFYRYAVIFFNNIKNDAKP